VVEADLCKSCGICVELCPAGVLAMGDEINRHGYRVVRVVHGERCVACRVCERFCPDFAIRVVEA